MNDQWDWSPASDSANLPAQQVWDASLDKPFLKQLLLEIHRGEFAGAGKGALNLEKIMVWGYSVGSQMVSWMIQLHASGGRSASLCPQRAASVGGCFCMCACARVCAGVRVIGCACADRRFRAYRSEG